MSAGGRAGTAARRLPLLAAVAAIALIATYLALGGATYKPLALADPCKPRPLEKLRERQGTLQRLSLSALDGAACSLRVPREELALALASPDARAEFVREHHITDAQLAAAVRGALMRSVEDAQRTGDLPPLLAPLLREAARRLPAGTVLDLLQRSTGRSPTELLGELLDRLRTDGGGPGG